jgi:transketolase
MGLLDVAFFRALGAVRGDDRESPLCWSFQPSDALAAYHCTRLMTQIDGLCYLRTHRPDAPLLYPPQTQFEPGGFHTLRPGGDLAIVSAGYMTHVSLRAVDALARQSVRAALLDVYSTPVKAAPLAEALARAGGVALVVEDNYGAGLGAEVAEVAAGHGGLRVRRLHVQRVPRSTRSPEEILEYCGVSDAQIADHALALLRRPDVA